MHRRKFLKSMAFGTGLFMLKMSPLSAKTGIEPTQKIIWIILRGGMDSLHAVIPNIDDNLIRLRAGLVEPLKNSLLPLDKQFFLHPALKQVHEMYTKGEFIPIVAVASPYRSRSHFDAQDILECGLDTINHDSGWLARAVVQNKGYGLAIDRSTPISLRGFDNSNTWFPSKLPEAGSNFYNQLSLLYQHDLQLKKSLDEGLKMRNAIEMTGKKKLRPKFPDLAGHCGELLISDPSYICAMLEMGGWDTHNNQVSRLNHQFYNLDKGMEKLRASLGDLWKQTVIIVASEFGRTVAMNGTQGTDHGTAGVLFLAGGAVNGRRIEGLWPGLSGQALFEGRDLMPTSDIRAWLAGVLVQHWGLTAVQIQKVFPGIKPVSMSLIKA